MTELTQRFASQVAAAYGMTERDTFDLIYDLDGCIEALGNWQEKPLRVGQVDLTVSMAVAAAVGRAFLVSRIEKTGPVVTPVIWAMLLSRQIEQICEINEYDILVILVAATDVLERHIAGKQIAMLPFGVAEQLRSVI